MSHVIKYLDTLPGYTPWVYSSSEEVIQIVRQILPEEPLSLKPDVGPIPDRHDWVEPIEAFLGDGIDE